MLASPAAALNVIVAGWLIRASTSPHPDAVAARSVRWPKGWNARRSSCQSPRPHLATRAAPGPLGTRTLAGRPARGGRPFQSQGRFRPIGRQRGVGPHDPGQRLIVLRTTGISFKPPHQRQSLFRTEIDLVEVLEKFEASKHDGLHLKGDQASDVGMPGLLYRNREEKSSAPVGRTGTTRCTISWIRICASISSMAIPV